ncbi:hypothetical protein MA16_Dca009946 [Dendrobium catenatum]|uniref:Uncharacterized protein n=1 Tax=Dendrobium catenatum TaxID=906689 RepID=A0A2I0WDA0_9ASPA|nr:hypothetical protein MA16_Dca009946 [Dendrobium catenatum]
MKACHIATLKAQEAASFDVHYVQLDVCDSFFSPGQIQIEGGTCKRGTVIAGMWSQVSVIKNGDLWILGWGGNQRSNCVALCCMWTAMAPQISQDIQVKKKERISILMEEKKISSLLTPKLRPSEAGVLFCHQQTSNFYPASNLHSLPSFYPAPEFCRLSDFAGRLHEDGFLSIVGLLPDAVLLIFVVRLQSS